MKSPRCLSNPPLPSRTAFSRVLPSNRNSPCPQHPEAVVLATGDHPTLFSLDTPTFAVVARRAELRLACFRFTLGDVTKARLGRSYLNLWRVGCGQVRSGACLWVEAAFSWVSDREGRKGLPGLKGRRAGTSAWAPLRELP